MDFSQNIPISQTTNNITYYQGHDYEFTDDFEAGGGEKITNFEEDYDTSPAQDESSSALLWAVLSAYLPDDERAIQKQFVQHAEYDLALTYDDIKNNPREQYYTLARSVRDRLIERWKDTELYFSKNKVKKLYYLSVEFLMGRSLSNAVNNLDLSQNLSVALKSLGIRMENLYEEETDPGLGNGGLGRLASCFLDALATLNYPAWGYGLRYQYGIFHQLINNGYQLEVPDYWLRCGNPWEIKRLDVQYTVNFYGRVTELTDISSSSMRYVWEADEQVVAVAYDVPIPGYKTYNTNNLRLWSSQPSKEFDFQLFHKGDYFAALENKQRSETITSVLYPNDNTPAGRELRLKQLYFFVCATLADIIKNYKVLELPLTNIYEKVTIQLNDTHPTLGIVELMRVLVDIENVPWDMAWSITQKVFSFTNHTVLPESLETWEVALVEHLLPRHLQIITNINHHFLLEVEKHFPAEDLNDVKAKLSLFQEEPVKKIRMAHLAIVGSHCVNGVAKIHSDLLKTHVFPEFYKMYPSAFMNITNGVTPRRWLKQANPSLYNLITEVLITEDWVKDLSLLSNLRQFANVLDFQKRWRLCKEENKKRLAEWIFQKLKIKTSVNALFDIQVKRFHEYKRQLLNILSVIWRYKQIKEMTQEQRAQCVPRVVIFGGKAAPWYQTAKLVIKLINAVQDKVNKDTDINDLLKVIFVPNYTVSLAELLVPASDLSQHISTAGMEASGTSNMKFAMNGGLIIGTLDGANIEIREEIGEGNMFIFGTRSEKVEEERNKILHKKEELDSRLKEVINMVKHGMFGDFPEANTLLDTILDGKDYYLVTTDWNSYLIAQEQVDLTFLNKPKWTEMSILSTAGCGKFSSDRSIREYAEKIWKLQAYPRPGPMEVDVQGLMREKFSDRLGVSFSPLQHYYSGGNSISLDRLSEEIATTVSSYSPSSSPYL